jgi:hypothetical protein
MVLHKSVAAARGQQLSKIAALRNGDSVAQARVKATRPSGNGSRVAFVFSLAKKRQKYWLSGIGGA